MHRLWIFAFMAAALALFLSAIPVNFRSNPLDGFEAERATAVKELIAGLESYVEWCSSKKIWVERNRALEAILVVDPGNMSAKRGLGWQQVADGVWEPPKEPKPAKNFDPGSLKEAPTKYAEAIKPWHEHLIRLLEAHKDELTPVQRESVCRDLIAIDPDDAYARAARGEEHSDKGWVLSETVRAKARRTEIKEIVRTALAQAPQAKDFAPTASDMAFTVAWKVSVSTDRVRVLSTGDRAEALRIAQVLHATRDVFQKVFVTSTSLGADFTIYLLCDPVAKKTFLDHLAGTSASQRSFYDHLDGTGLPASHSAAWWIPSPERRLDGVTRHTLGAMFQTEFNLSVDVPWAWEGLGLYLTRELIGTRLTYYIALSPDNQALTTNKGNTDWIKKIMTPGMNWMNEGYRLMRAGDASSLTATLTRPLNKMTPPDLFVSYVTSAYLLEAQAQQLPGMLRAFGGGPNRPGQMATDVWPGALSMNMDAFAPRLERWLGERR